MKYSRQHVLICYGNKLGYYHGAKYQILRGYHWLKNYDIRVVTDRPDLFYGYPINLLRLDERQIHEWSLEGRNHFGIKLRGLHWAIESAPAHIQKSVLLDTDMYWTKDPEKVQKLIGPHSSVLYQDEGPIFGSKDASIRRYSEGLSTQRIANDACQYELSALSRMWRSSIIGVDHSNGSVLTEAFELFRLLSPHVKAHTVEQFALGETLRNHQINLIEAKHLVGDWSSIGKKNYATPILAEFFKKFGELDFNTHLDNVHKIKIKRPISVFLKQKVDRWKKP